MEGITILNETATYCAHYGVYIVWGCCIVAGVIIGVIFGAHNSYHPIVDGITEGLLGLMLGTLFGLAVTGLVAQVWTTDEIDYIDYQVTIDDTVSFNELYEKYEVIDQDGQIFTIRERN